MDIKKIVKDTLIKYQQQDYKRGGVSIDPSNYEAIANTVEAKVKEISCKVLVSGQFLLTELEQKRFDTSNAKQITFYLRGGIGMKKVITDDDGDELDITDYDGW